MIGFLSVMTGALFHHGASAATYRFVDEDGVTHYTNAPTDPSYQRFVVRLPSPRPSPSSAPGSYSADVRQAADRYAVDPRLVEAVIAVESAGNPSAVSSKGAQGLMQLMPATAAVLGVHDPFNPRQNIDGGIRHLRGLLDSFGDLPLALAAYNAGAEPVRSFRGIPPYQETQEYVRKILHLYSGEHFSEPAAVSSQRVYRRLDSDGTITYTNLPPRLNSAR